MITTDPKAEIDLNESFVKALIATQFPDLAKLKIEFLDAGWDNENYRLGSKYMIRIPRRKVAAELVLNEIIWLPKLKKIFPINIPSPFRVGKPDQNYPWHWSIIPWFEGETADISQLNETEANKLIDFLKALHVKNPEHAPKNLHRGVPLERKSVDLAMRMERLKIRTDLITKKIENYWYEAVNEPQSLESSLIHGDLHPRNIVTNNGKIEAIIDWGDITEGDPANDLSCLWMLFEHDEIRQEALKIYGASKSLIKRSIGWAIFFGIIMLDTGLHANPKHAKIGEFILKNVNKI